MRHGKKFNHLKRKKGHRTATLTSLSNALIQHKRIMTTLAKAKALRQHIEPILTRAKTNTTHSRRVAFKYLKKKKSVEELFGPIAEKIADRPGGYTRVIKMGARASDAAEMAMIELVDFNDVMLQASQEKPASGRTRRSRRGRRRKGGDVATPVVASKGEEE